MRARLAAALLIAAPAGAEPLYVTDRVVVAVNETADGTGREIARLETGDRIEVLERLGDQARVRLTDGAEGWVAGSQLSAQAPARGQLTARLRELETTKAALSRAESELADARAELERLQAPKTSEPEPALAAIGPTARPLFPARNARPAQPSWLAFASGCLAALGVGFAIGWRVLDRRIRRKYGGLRIY